MMMPPPTPVPSVTMTMFWYPAPPPCHISPSAATLASFPALTRSPVSTLRRCSTLNTSQPRLTHLNTVPSGPTGPGTPSPMPSTSKVKIFFSLSLSSTACAISFKINLPSASVRVGISHISSSLPLVSNRPILIVVPPISTPNAYVLLIFFSLSLETGKRAQAPFFCRAYCFTSREKRSLGVPFLIRMRPTDQCVRTL